MNQLECDVHEHVKDAASSPRTGTLDTCTDTSSSASRFVLSSRSTRGRYEDLLAGCAPDITHRFGGDHALGGERHDKEALRLCFARLGRLVPGLRLNVHDVWVRGWPWNTVAIARWTSTGSYPDGSAYTNHGVHIVRLRWGRATSIDANEDSLAVQRLLAAVAAADNPVAAAALITS